MTSHDTVITYLDAELDVEHYNDAGDKFNGALVVGEGTVTRIGACTNCTFETIAAAADEGCDLVVSHHGGWEEFDGGLLAEKTDRIRDAGMTWYIAHHALDCADEDYGVAVALAEELGIDIDAAYGEIEGGRGGRYGTLAVSPGAFRDRLERIEEDYETVGDLDGLEDARIGVIGGSGGVFRSLIDETVAAGCDVLVTGNASFFGKIHAYEHGLSLVLLEETSSEKWGVHRLGEHLKERFEDVELVRLEETNW
ncbi:MAG: Nif3-like dinuclear metal center hexameric protein [Candidatus Nanohaloarchaea archaeon]|nr:Nif3-like dinuclear metal center hexameric protein [Candidatus Nanohaloarchaea archaeon]